MLPTDLPPSAAVLPASQSVDLPETDSLFERYAWIYAFFREHLFRDDTVGIATALWPSGSPPPGAHLLVELGCGPGFYSCRFAERYPGLSVLGIDRSPEQIRRAEGSARKRGLRNCRFEEANALALGLEDGSVDALVAARLFTVLPEREQAVEEMHRVLRAGSRCFIAEPCSRLRTAVPLRLMWLLAHVMTLFGNYQVRPFREPARAAVLPPDVFGALVLSQPWRSVWRWQDRYYQYAICEKGALPERERKPSHKSNLENEDFSI